MLNLDIILSFRYQPQSINQPFYEESRTLMNYTFLIHTREAGLWKKSGRVILALGVHSPFRPAEAGSIFDLSEDWKPNWKWLLGLIDWGEKSIAKPKLPKQPLVSIRHRSAQWRHLLMTHFGEACSSRDCWRIAITRLNHTTACWGTLKQAPTQPAAKQGATKPNDRHNMPLRHTTGCSPIGHGGTYHYEMKSSQRVISISTWAFDSKT